jgi:hypothetical protein
MCSATGVHVAHAIVRVAGDHRVGNRSQGDLGALLLLEQGVGRPLQLLQRGLQHAPGHRGLLQVVHQFVESLAESTELVAGLDRRAAAEIGRRLAQLDDRADQAGQGPGDKGRQRQVQHRESDA